MPDNFYPSVDINFIKNHVIASGKLTPDGIVSIGATTTFIINGKQAIFKRTISVRELQQGQVCFEQATALAIRFSFMGELLTWLEAKKNWKEGAYIVP